MKSGTAYAAKLKKAFAKHRTNSVEAKIPELMDPLHALALGILGVKSRPEQTQRAINHLLSNMAGWNEVRISTPLEVKEAVDTPASVNLAETQRLTRALQGIFDRENVLSLDRLKTIGRREARQYLDELEGVDDYATAMTFLWGLGGHAIPVCDKLLQSLREADLVHPSATRGEVQAFLERHISAADAREFCVIMYSFAPTGKRTTKKTPKTGKPKASKKKSVKKKVSS